MQTEEQVQEEQPVEETGRGLDAKQLERKQKLQTKKNKDYNNKLPKAEESELQELLAIEKAEYDRRALIHRLASAADKYGRKAIAVKRREVTDRVKALNADESTEIAGLQKIYLSGKKEMEKEMKRAMQQIQEDHGKAIKELQAEKDKDMAAVRARYKEGYDQASSDITCGTDAIATQVAEFVEDIQPLEIEQLQKLQTDGLLQTGDRKNASFIVVPGSPEPKPA